MIHFFSETEFELQDQDFYSDWLHACVDSKGFEVGNLNYIFCDDNYLLEINKNHLNHNYYTDIITFDYSEEFNLHGDIFISVERIADNAHDFNTSFEMELARVMVHGLLHMMGLKDKSDAEREAMRSAEDQCLKMLYQSNEEE